MLTSPDRATTNWLSSVVRPPLPRSYAYQMFATRNMLHVRAPKPSWPLRFSTKMNQRTANGRRWCNRTKKKMTATKSSSEESLLILLVVGSIAHEEAVLVVLHRGLEECMDSILLNERGNLSRKGRIPKNEKVLSEFELLLL